MSRSILLNLPLFILIILPVTVSHQRSNQFVPFSFSGVLLSFAEGLALYEPGWQGHQVDLAATKALMSELWIGFSLSDPITAPTLNLKTRVLSQLSVLYLSLQTVLQGQYVDVYRYDFEIVFKKGVFILNFLINNNL